MSYNRNTRNYENFARKYLELFNQGTYSRNLLGYRI